VLIDCPECKKQVSDQAQTCPHCGVTLKVIAKPKEAAQPIWLVIAAIAFVVLLFTPRLLATFPVLLALVASAISLFRGERYSKGAAGTVLALTLLVMFGTYYPSMRGGDTTASSPSSFSTTVTDDGTSSAEIVDWNWAKDPNFGGDGAVIWNVQIKNTSDRNIAAVRVQLTTYDAAGKLVTSDDTYVNAIPPGGTGSGKAYADYYGTEDKAEVRVVDVRFAR